MVCNFFQVKFSTSKPVTVIALALRSLVEKLYNNANCTQKEKTVFGKARKKKFEEKPGKDELKLITKLTQESWKPTTTFWKA